MTDTFDAMVATHRARMEMLKAVLKQGGCIHAVSQSDPSYSLLLTRSTDSEGGFRITSFRNRQPIGHRDYDVLEGRAPAFNALQEFASPDMRIINRPARRVVQTPQP